MLFRPNVSSACDVSLMETIKRIECLTQAEIKVQCFQIFFLTTSYIVRSTPAEYSTLLYTAYSQGVSETKDKNRNFDPIDNAAPHSGYTPHTARVSQKLRTRIETSIL